jgi:transcription antitermination factor NusG
MFHRVREVMFERIVFVEFDRDRDPWQPILKAGGVRRLIAREDGMPIAVERGFIDQLIAGDDERLQLQEKMMPLRPGVAVRVEEGALTGNTGVVLDCDGFQTMIDLQLFNGRLVRTHLPRSSLSLISEG